jgi:hypothetical protein
MALADIRLALLTFPQRWTGTQLDATVLVVPSGDPTTALFPAVPTTSAFAGTTIPLRAAAVGGLDAMPTLASPSDPLTLVGPATAAALFAELKTRFSPVDQTAGPPPATPPHGTLRKALPDTYVALLPPGGPRSPFAGSLDEFGCTMRAQEPQKPPPTRPDPAWGEVISHALRNPSLADALGLRYTFSVPIADPTPFADGGWLFVTLDPADGGTGYGAAWTATPDAVRVFAARLPALTANSRAVFAAVLFPVTNSAAVPPTPDQGAIDEAIIEAEAYDDGFAKLVHARQPDSIDAHIGDGAVAINAATDAGIQIGWDDEQVLTWHNRQIDIAHRALTGDPVPLESPLGVQGYRVDIRQPVAGETPAQRDQGWTSLMQATGTPPPPLDQLVANFVGEVMVEPTAAAPGTATRPDEFWLPLYFAQWRGTPIGLRDDTPHLLSGGVAAGKEPPVVPSAFVGADVPPLVYGRRYEVRVRLGDQSGGGPLLTDLPANETTADRAAVDFARYVSPNAFGVDATVEGQITLRRPTIGYPEALFTARYGTRPEVRDAARSAMLAQLGLGPDGTPLPPADRVPDSLTVGVPDPDVTAVEVRVEVRALGHDTGDDVAADGSFTTLYVTERGIPPLDTLPAGPVTPVEAATDVPIPPLQLAFSDVDDVATLNAPPAVGPLPLPRARDVRLVLTPVATGAAGYFGTVTGRPQPTRGASAKVTVRAASDAEADPLLVAPPGGRPTVEGYFFQPATAGDPVAALMTALADQLDLVADGLTLRAPPGTRVAFGTAAGLAATIRPDGGAITFSAAADLFRKWTVGVRYDLVRDWTWDGLAGWQVVVRRGGEPIGAITVPPVATPESLAGTPDRTHTRLVFFEAIDPAVADPADGFTDRPPYTLEATIPDAAGGTITATTDPVALRLPVVVPPSGVPRLVSAGYALSPYAAAPDYSSTADRTRHLWLEVDEPPAAGDALFARVLAYGPDPLLYVDANVLRAEPPAEPALKLDPESVRVISPGQPRDEDGSEAMVRLTASSDDPTRFLLPLPDGVAADDSRLFGMWTYELRFGHVDPWSTAHGRYGRPLRVTGVQHPAPPAACAAAWRPQPATGRAPNDLVASAAYATPVLDGRQVGDGIPRSVLGFLLYAQGRQADGSGSRNVLLAHHGADLVFDRGRVDYGSTTFFDQEIDTALRSLGLPPDSPLSVLAVEFYSGGGAVGAEYRSDQFRRGRAPDLRGIDPFGDDFFGKRRILRTSPLVRVEPVC